MGDRTNNPSCLQGSNAVFTDTPAPGQKRRVAKMHTLNDNWCMSTGFDWSTEKNQRLIDQRRISFEIVVSAIEQGGLVDVLEHPNQDRYPGQLIYVVEIGDYIHLVPFVTQTDGTRFLKTIIPSRKATRDYRRRQST